MHVNSLRRGTFLRSSFVLVPAFLLVLGAALTAFARERGDDDAQEAREEAFAKLLTGAKMSGWFTESSHPDAPPMKDSYVISKAEKIDDEKWQLKALIGESGLELPIQVDVKWAGETPVITLDQYAVPQMGTFDARVLFFGTSYAGVWRGANHGGEMAGHVERADGAKSEPVKDPKKK